MPAAATSSRRRAPAPLSRPWSSCLAGSLLLAATAACGGREAKSPPPPTLSSAPPGVKTVSPSVGVSDDILKACELGFNRVEETPKFDFDASELSSSDRDALERIGKCLTTGPLKGRSVKLVGRADPRGPTDYNLALGARRASSVGTYLKHLGVEASRLQETSRGELDATGTDEVSWRNDRRVDVLLAD